MFKSALRDRIVTTSPCVDIRLPTKKPASLLQVLSTEQVLLMADTIADRYRAVILTAAGTGLRPGELFGLRASQVDFLRRTIRVDQQLVRVRGQGVTIAPLKTEASYRTLPLPQVVADAMAVHIATWPAHPDLGVMFTNERGGPIQQHPFAAVWETARRKAALPEWATPHDLRHYLASLLIRSSASVKVVQARLGHASAKTTLDVYGHLFADEEDRTRAAIDTELRSPASSARPEPVPESRNRRSDGLSR